jgi:hypothetical protein
MGYRSPYVHDIDWLIRKGRPIYSTELQECEMCGRIGSPKLINYKSMRSPSGMEFAGIQCISCWNKAKPLAKRALDCNENKYIINKIIKEIANGKDNHK